MPPYVIYNFSLSQEKANINNIIFAEKKRGVLDSLFSLNLKLMSEWC